MAQGVLYQMPSGLARLPTKKALKAQAEAHPETIEVTSTSIVSHEFAGPAIRLLEGDVVYVVGPDPYEDRRWYAQIERKGDRLIVR